MIIRSETGVNRSIRVNLAGLGADKCNYYTIYRDYLDPCFKEYTQYIKRKTQV